MQVSREILELLNASTAKEQSIVEKFRSRGRAQVQEFCDHGTKEDCVRSGDTPQPCTKLHFRLASSKRPLSCQLNASARPVHISSLSLSAASSTSTRTRASATAPSSTPVSTWTLASTSTTRSTAHRRLRGTCWGPRLGPRSWDSTRGTQTVTWANCFLPRWGEKREKNEQVRIERHRWTFTEGFFHCSGFAATSATWTCPSWGNLQWWWPTHRGTSTWSCRTGRWLTTRWENSTSPSCKTTASSSSGSLAGQKSGSRVSSQTLTHYSVYMFSYWLSSCRAMELGRECLNLWG